MATPPASVPPPPIKQDTWGSFKSIQVVLVVAFIVATLFTAWTPGANLPPSPAEQVAINNPSNPGFRPTATPTRSGAPTATRRARPLIGLVSGHWGNDSGSVCSDGLTEAEVNQMIATNVQKDLVSKGYDVDLLKEFDNRLTGYQASVLISIHNDSCQYINDQATGFKVASAMANPFPERAARLTACLRSRYSQATGLSLHSTSVTRDMTDYHAFNEIDPGTTAAIIETGFLNLDRQFLTQHTDKVALGITEGILCFMNNESINLPDASPPSTPSQPSQAITNTVPIATQPAP